VSADPTGLAAAAPGHEQGRGRRLPGPALILFHNLTPNEVCLRFCLHSKGRSAPAYLQITTLARPALDTSVLASPAGRAGGEEELALNNFAWQVLPPSVREPKCALRIGGAGEAGDFKCLTQVSLKAPSSQPGRGFSFRPP
jgi:hypothetical protein